MTNVTALVQSATLPQTDLSDLWDIYKGYANRSRQERKQMKRALTMVKDESLLDIRGLFALPEAWNGDFPTVALAKISWKSVDFHYWGSVADTARLAGMKRSGTFDLESYYNISFFIPVNASPRMSRKAKAIVPFTPKAILPWNPLTRRKLYTLFDANWKTLAMDPYLLERINDNQFRVVGHWDISDKERQLMALMGQYIA